MVVVKPAELLERRVLFTTFYVDTNNPAASDNNPGTSIDAPLKTIGQAFDLAENDNATSQSDTILIRGGVYHEEPFLYDSGSGASPTDRTTISAYVDPATGKYEPVYIDAADPTVGTWTQVGTSNVWYLDNFTTETSGVWVDWSPSNDGAPLQQIGSYGDPYFDNRTVIGSGVSDMYAGTYYGDLTDSRLYVWLADGSDPNKHSIEYAANSHGIYSPGDYTGQGLYGGYTYANNVDFVGLNIRHVNNYGDEGQDVGAAIYIYGDDRLIDMNIQYCGGIGFYLRDQAQAIDCISSNNGQNGAMAQGYGFLIQAGQYDGNYTRHYLDGGNAAIKVITDNPDLYGDIENAEMSDNFGKGIWFDTCFANDVISQITGNYIHDNEDAGIDLEASRNFLVANNVIINNGAGGISINAVENATICNNTIVGNSGIAAIELDGGARDEGYGYTGIIATLNDTVENNIIADNFTVYDLDIPTAESGTEYVDDITSDFNLFYRWGSPLRFTTGGTYSNWAQTPSTLVGWQTDSGEDAHSIVADPLFLFGGTGADAFRLGANSPAIAAGAVINQLTVDFAGNLRPTSGAYSIGAFEYSTGGNGTAGAVITNTDPDVWVDDQLPDDASMTPPDAFANQGENRFWYWTDSNVYSGVAADDSGVISGAHRQYFTGANPRPVADDDMLWAYVWIDPANPPQEIMFEWEDSTGSWAHQAYWGADLLDGGVDGSVAGQHIGDLPTAGQWTLLSVPASTVGLAGESITGFSFDLYDGRSLLDKIGTGALPIANTLNVDSGSYRFALNIRTDQPDLILNVAAGASVTFASAPGAGTQSYQLAELNLENGATASIEQSDASADLTTLIISSLNLGGTSSTPLARLDINNNDLIIHNGDTRSLTAALASAFDGGSWKGSAGITSSDAAADPTFLTAIGLETGITGELDGQSITATDDELKYTYYGDANLDGQVDGSDYTLIDNGFNTGATGWFNGDFNYDGVVDGSDYTLIDNAFNMQGVSLAAAVISQPKTTTKVAAATVAATIVDQLIRADYVMNDLSLEQSSARVSPAPEAARQGQEARATIGTVPSSSSRSFVARTSRPCRESFGTGETLVLRSSGNRARSTNPTPTEFQQRNILTNRRHRRSIAASLAQLAAPPVEA